MTRLIPPFLNKRMRTSSRVRLRQALMRPSQALNGIWANTKDSRTLDGQLRESHVKAMNWRFSTQVHLRRHENVGQLSTFLCPTASFRSSYLLVGFHKHGMTETAVGPTKRLKRGYMCPHQDTLLVVPWLAAGQGTTNKKQVA